MKWLLCGLLAAFLAFQTVRAAGFGLGYGGSFYHKHQRPMGPPPPPPPPQNVQSEYLKSLQKQIALEKLEASVEEVCPGYGHKVENVTNTIKECVENTDMESETLCSAFKNHVVGCFQPAVDLFEECLPKDSKGLPSFAVKSWSAVVEHLCKTDGEHLLELSNKCILTPTYKLQRCARKAATFGRQVSEQRVTPTVENVCNLMTSLKTCMTSHVNLLCGHPITRTAVIDVMDKAVSACPSDNSVNEVELVNPTEE